MTETTAISEEEYVEIQAQLVTLAAVINEMNLDGFLEAINRCESKAPILAPALYRAGASKLDKVRDLARAFRGVQSEVRRQLGEESDG